MNWLRVKNNAELRLNPNAEESITKESTELSARLLKASRQCKITRNCKSMSRLLALSVSSIIYMDTGLPVTCRKTFKLKHCGGILVLVKVISDEDMRSYYSKIFVLVWEV